MALKHYLARPRVRILATLLVVAALAVAVVYITADPGPTSVSGLVAQTQRTELAALRAEVAHLHAMLHAAGFTDPGEVTSTAPSSTVPSTVTTVPPTTSTTTIPTTTTAAPTTTTTAAPTTTSTTTPPSGACVGLQVPAGANLVALALSNPAGTTYCLAPGIYTVTANIEDQTGDRWIGALDANGARQSILTGNDVQPYAFQTVGNNVVLANIVIEHFKSPAQRSPFATGFYLGGPTGWVIDNVESRYNWGTGLTIGSAGVIRNSYVHHNHQNGITSFGATGALVEHNEIAFNNWLGEYDPNWEAGGSKFLKQTNLTLHANNVHDNCGPGLWNDSDNVGTIYDTNVLVNNAGPGIMHEISYEARIQSNHLEGNGHGTLGPGGPVCRSGFSGMLGGIYVSTSRGVEVFGNTLVNNDGGIIAQQENRGTGRLGVWESDGLNIHDNSITFSAAAANPWHGFRFVGGSATLTGMRFEGNDYDVPSTAGTWWMWNGLKTWAQWQALGYDDTGSVN